MSLSDILLVPVLLSLVVIVWAPFWVVTLGLLTIGENRHQPWRSFGSWRNIEWLLLDNAIVLTIFLGVWYWGYSMSERWMRIIDTGAPWSWFIALFVGSYIASMLSLHKIPKMIFKSLLGPMITVPVFCLWIIFCEFWFDPFY